MSEAYPCALPRIEADEDWYRIIFSRQEGTVTPTVTPTVAFTVKMLLELLLKKGECGSADIRNAFGLKDRVHVHKSYLQPALDAGLIEMTLPDKPNSRLQQYRLTKKGRRLVAEMKLNE